MDATYAFGRFELSTAARELLAGGAPVALGARAFDVLAGAGRAPRPAGRPRTSCSTLVWPNVVVEENNLQVQISALRKLLGPQAIATIPGRGYRFTALLAGGAQPAHGAAAAACAPATPPAPPLAPTCRSSCRRCSAARDDLAMLRDARRRARARHARRRRAASARPASRRPRRRRSASVRRRRLGGRARPGHRRRRGCRARCRASLELRSEPSRARPTSPRCSPRAACCSCSTTASTCSTPSRSSPRQLQRQAPHVRVLATSQEPLKLATSRSTGSARWRCPDTPSLARRRGGRRGRAVRRARAGRGPALRADRRQRGDGGRDLPPARRHSARDRARRGAGAAARRRRPVRAAERPLSRADRRRAPRAAPPPDAARRARMELRPARPATSRPCSGGSACSPASFGLDSAQHVIAAGGDRRMGRARSARRARRQVAGGGRRRRPSRATGCSKPDARSRSSSSPTPGRPPSAVRRHAEATLAVFERSWRERWTAVTQRRARALRPRARQPARRARLVGRTRRRSPTCSIALAGASAWLWKFAALQQRRPRAVPGRRCARPAGNAARDRGALSVSASRCFGHNQSVAADAAAAATRRAIECFRALGDREGLYRALAFRSRLPQRGRRSRGRRTRPRRGDGAARSCLAAGPAHAAARRARVHLHRPGAARRGRRDVGGAAAHRRSRWAMRGSPSSRSTTSSTTCSPGATSPRRSAAAASWSRWSGASGSRATRASRSAISSAALTAAGELDEALVVAREAVPLLRQQGALAAFLVHFAMLAARRGRIADAARALGCEERAVARAGLPAPVLRGARARRAREAAARAPRAGRTAAAARGRRCAVGRRRRAASRCPS